MTRKLALILIVSFFTVVFGALVYSYFYFFPQGEVDGVEDRGFRNFFPFSGDGDIVDNEFGSGFPTAPGGGVMIPLLRKISSEPVVGFTTYSTSTSTTTPAKNIFRYVSRATGNIYDIEEDSIEAKRISNTTIPKLFESYFLNLDKVVLRFLKEDNQTIETYLGDLVRDGDGNYQGLEGIYLAQGISDVAVSPSGDFFYLQKTETGSIGTALDVDKNISKRIFESPLSEFLFEWPRENVLIYNTRPSASVPGYLFTLNPSTGATSKVIGGQNALSAIGSENSNLGIFSENSGGKISLKGLDIVTSSFYETGLSTLSEKCTWTTATAFCAVPKSAPAGNFPDAWYQGRFFFTDNLWEVNIIDESNTLLLDLSEQAGEDIDAINLQVTDDGEYLLFVNKRDGSLWAFRLKEVPAPVVETNEQESAPEVIEQ